MKKFTISTAALKKMLHKLGYAVSGKPTLPVLGNIWFKVHNKCIEVTAFDLEVTIQNRVEVETTGDAFEFLASFQLLQKIVALSSGPLTFSQEKKCIRITGEDDVYDLQSNYPIEDFPRLATVPKKTSMQLNGNIIQWLMVALKTVGTDEKKPQMTKVLLELREKTTTVASTDAQFAMFSYSLELSAPGKEDILITPRVIEALEGQEDVKLSWTEKIYAFDSKELTIIVNRPDEKFVNFRAIIPADFDTNLSLPRAMIIAALEKCAISSHPLKETVLDMAHASHVNFKAVDDQFGIAINVAVPGDYKGNLSQVRFNAKKMLTLMHQVKFENIEVAAHVAGRPVLFRSSEDKGYLGLMVPMADPK